MNNFISSLSKINLPLLKYFDLCFDLGTSNTRIAVIGKGIVLREPTVIGYNDRSKEYIFYGDEAKKIIGKTPDFIKIIKPLHNSVISDFDSQTELIKKYMNKAVEPYLQSYKIIRPTMRAVCIIPTTATEIERRAVEEVLMKVGISKVYLVSKPLAAAAGSEIDVFSHQPNFIIDMGGGLIELAIISGGGIVSRKSIVNAGEHMNGVLANYCYLKYGVVLGEATTEDLKINLLNFVNEDRTVTVRGKSLENGLPKSIRLRSAEVKEALLNNFNHIVDAAKELIEASPPEVVEDIYNRGIILSGELTKIDGIESFFTTELKIETMVSPQAGNATIQGLVSICSNYENVLKLAYNTT